MSSPVPTPIDMDSKSSNASIEDITHLLRALASPMQSKDSHDSRINEIGDRLLELSAEAETAHLIVNESVFSLCRSLIVKCLSSVRITESADLRDHKIIEENENIQMKQQANGGSTTETSLEDSVDGVFAATVILDMMTNILLIPTARVEIMNTNGILSDILVSLYEECLCSSSDPVLLASCFRGLSTLVLHAIDHKVIHLSKIIVSWIDMTMRNSLDSNLLGQVTVFQFHISQTIDDCEVKADIDPNTLDPCNVFMARRYSPLYKRLYDDGLDVISLSLTILSDERSISSLAAFPTSLSYMYSPTNHSKNGFTLLLEIFEGHIDMLNENSKATDKQFKSIVVDKLFSTAMDLTRLSLLETRSNFGNYSYEIKIAILNILQKLYASFCHRQESMEYDIHEDFAKALAHSMKEATPKIRRRLISDLQDVYLESILRKCIDHMEIVAEILFILLLLSSNHEDEAVKVSLREWIRNTESISLYETMLEDETSVWIHRVTRSQGESLRNSREYFSLCHNLLSYEEKDDKSHNADNRESRKRRYDEIYSNSLSILTKVRNLFYCFNGSVAEQSDGL